MLLMSDLYLALQREVGDQGGVFINQTDTLRWANEGIKDIIRKAQLDNTVQDTVVVAQGASTLNLGTGNLNLYKIEFVKINDGYEMRETTLSELDRLVPNFNLTDDTGMPGYWWATTNTHILAIYPKADQAYTAVFRGSAFPENATAGDDALITFLPREYHDSLLRFCVSRARRREKDNQGAREAMDEYLEDVRLRFSEANSKSDEFDTIQPDDYEQASNRMTLMNAANDSNYDGGWADSYYVGFPAVDGGYA